jgi:sigma-B regulation protein RsbU (phosphoserine phosphatase)
MLDSTGVGTLVACRAAAQRVGLRFAVVATRPIVYRILQVVGLIEALNVSMSAEPNGGESGRLPAAGLMPVTTRTTAPDPALDVEQQRLAAVRRFAILDTPPEDIFDRICALAARIFNVPIATVSIVDEDRIWFKAATGLSAGQIPRDPGLCASAILTDGPYLVTDAAVDPRTLNNPLVRGALGLRFYAAAPIVTAAGHRLGTVDVIDTQPRQVTDAELDRLADLAAIVGDELELRLAALRQATTERAARRRAEAEWHHAQDVATALGHNLVPSRLAYVPGLETAAFHQPLSDDHIGGDFYDLFPTDASGTWAVFLGDVCGKGLAAAALTALVRYTLRAAALIDDDPAACWPTCTTPSFSTRKPTNTATAPSPTADSNPSRLATGSPSPSPGTHPPC